MRSKSQAALFKFKQNTHSIQSKNGIRNSMLEAFIEITKKRRRATLKKKTQRSRVGKRSEHMYGALFGIHIM